VERTDETSQIGDQLVRLLRQIASLYDDEIYITLVTRSLGSPDGSRDTLISNDTDGEALREALDRLWKQRESREVGVAVRKELNG
jgi:hypothetical protein